MDKMLILPGIQRSGGLYNPHGLLDRDSAIKYAEINGYTGLVLEVSGETGADSPQTTAALRAIRADPAITALYGFSGGGYNAAHVLRHLTDDEKDRISFVVVLGAPHNPPSVYRGPWLLVYRTDPPDGHMAGPRALLEELKTA